MGKPLRLLVLVDKQNDALVEVAQPPRRGWEGAWERIDAPDAKSAPVDGSHFGLILWDRPILHLRAPDGVSDGRRLPIATSNVEKDEAYARLHAAVGRHICPAGGNTGQGVNRETSTRIFESFFATTVGAMATAWAPPVFRGSSSRARDSSTCMASPGRARPSRSTCVGSTRQPTDT